ncbi:hypothetical protein BDZ91DRAFT_694336 [Kalaharituber pfeilii]|nr:hypothetical protein BDZ91DRAFT_694336 [Kalaharituber pfeilii]
MDEFDAVSWTSPPRTHDGTDDGGSDISRPTSPMQREHIPFRHQEEPQAGPNADAIDLAGVGQGRLVTRVSDPTTENDGTKDAFVSYLVTTETDFPTFNKPRVGRRRRFTDFLFLWKELCKDFPACAVPPLPDKHKMEYVRGDRFGVEFTQRRARSLHRFLKRLTLHPELRKTALLVAFLESPEWNSHMRLRPTKVANNGEGGVFEGLTDTFLNAFSKVHKPDRRFIEVRERADKLDEDLGHVEKIIARVVRREADLESDYADLAAQFKKLEVIEPHVADAIHSFAVGVEDTSAGFRKLKEHTDQDYLGSLRDMEAYIIALKQLLRAREQKQLDFEGLTDYLNKAVYEKEQLANPHATTFSGGGASAFLQRKIEDVRGVDHEQAKKEKIRKLELKIEELSKGADEAKKETEAFDDEVVREVADFERIKTIEFRDTLGDLAQANMDFYSNMVKTWEGMLRHVEERFPETSERSAS